MFSIILSVLQVCLIYTTFCVWSLSRWISYTNKVMTRVFNCYFYFFKRRSFCFNRFTPSPQIPFPNIGASSQTSEQRWVENQLSGKKHHILFDFPNYLKYFFGFFFTKSCSLWFDWIFSFCFFFSLRVFYVLLSWGMRNYF